MSLPEHCKVSGLSFAIAVIVIVTSLMVVMVGPGKVPLSRACSLVVLSMTLVIMDLVSARWNASDIVLLAGPDGLVCYGLIRV